jgi:hypothetical protein
MERAETLGFGPRQFLLDHGVDAAPARAFVESFPQLGQVLRVAGCDDLDMAVFGVAHPAAKIEPGGFAMDKPAKSDALDAAFD